MRKELFLAALLGLCPFAAGCSSQEQPAAKETVKEPETTKAYDVTIGRKTDKTVDTVLKNTLSQTITSVKIREQGSDSFSDNLLGADQSFDTGQTLHWFYEPAEPAEAEDPETKKLNPVYIVEFGLKNGEIRTLNEFSFPSGKGTADLCEKDGIVYLTYTSSDGEKVDTFEQEKAAADKQKEAQEAAAETETSEPAAETVPEQSVAQQPVVQEPVYQEPVYQEPVVEQPAVTEPAPAPTVPDVGSQGSEGCLGGDVVFN